MAKLHIIRLSKQYITVRISSQGSCFTPLLLSMFKEPLVVRVMDKLIISERYTESVKINLRLCVYGI